MLKLTLLGALYILLTSIAHAQTASEQSSISCIESVCGKNNPFAHPFDVNPEMKISTMTKLVDELKIKRPIQLYMGRLIHKTVTQDQIFKQLINHSNKIEVSPKGKALILSFSYARRMSEFIPAIKSINDINYFDQAELQKLLPSSSNNEIAAIMSLTPMFSARQRLGGLDKKPLEMLLRYLHPDKTMLEAQVIEAERILQAQKKLWSYLQNLSFLGEVDAVVLKASKGEQLNYLEKNHLKEEILNAATIEVFLTDNVQQKFSLLPLDISKFLNTFKSTYESSQQAHLVKNPKTSKALLQENVNICLTNLSYAYAALPNDKQLQDFKSMTGQVMSVTKHMLEEKYNSTINDLGIEIVYPENRDNMIAGFINGINSIAEESEESEKNYKLVKSFKIEDSKNLDC